MRRPPHAPYRAGAPQFTPALEPIDPAAWLNPDTEAAVCAWKRALLTRPETVFRMEPGAEAAAGEAARLVGDAMGSPCEDLLGASALVSDDLVVMERQDGAWVCSALTLTAPTYFPIDDAFGHSLDAMHGPVPEGVKLSNRIGRIFDGLMAGQVLERFNWTIQCGPERRTPSAAPLRNRAAGLDPMHADLVLHLRVERQTIRKLPETGAVLFTIRVCLDPLVAIPVEDRAGLAKAWRALGEAGRAYKRWDAMERLTAAVFEGWGV